MNSLGYRGDGRDERPFDLTIFKNRVRVVAAWPAGAGPIDHLLRLGIDLAHAVVHFRSDAEQNAVWPAALSRGWTGMVAPLA